MAKPNIQVVEVYLTVPKEPRDVKQGISVDTKKVVRKWLHKELGWDSCTVTTLKSLDDAFTFRCVRF